MKFYGEIGYGITVEKGDGVWVDEIVEKNHYGDVTRTSRMLQDGEKVNPDISVQNSISIVADAFASENFFAMRYVKWAGTYWTVVEATVERPRLVLRLGGVYNGPKAAAPPAP